jgi:hypothetical protein
MSDYLWDKTGEPDASVERLEALLSSFGHAPRPLELPAEETPAVPRRPRRFGVWRRLIPAWLFEPVGLAAAAALMLTLLLGAGALMRARVTRDEDRAASREARPTQSQPPSQATPQLDSSERGESPSTTQAAAAAGRGPESAHVAAKVEGGVPFVREVGRVRVGAQPAAFLKPRQRPAAAAGVEREAQTTTLEAMSAGAREGAVSLFDNTRLLAKEQLIYALRLTGAKLKEVERKTHGAGDSKPSARGGVR